MPRDVPWLVCDDIVHRNINDLYYRKNGFTLPIHVSQLLALFLGVCLVAGSVLILVPCIPQRFHLAAYITIGVLAVAILVEFVWVSVCDPVDAKASQVLVARKEQRRSVLEPPSLPVTEDDFYCDVCRLVDPSSRHCNVCNKCVEHFDHHCVWVNNCIGKATCTLLSSLILIAGIVVAIVDVVDHSCRANWLAHYQTTSTIGFYVMLYSLLILNVAIFGLLWQLLVLHVFFCIKGITTYEYFTTQYKRALDEDDDDGSGGGGGGNGNHSPVPLYQRCSDWMIINRKRVKQKKKRMLADIEAAGGKDDGDDDDDKRELEATVRLEGEDLNLSPGPLHAPMLLPGAIVDAMNPSACHSLEDGKDGVQVGEKLSNSE